MATAILTLGFGFYLGNLSGIISQKEFIFNQIDTRARGYNLEIPENIRDNPAMLLNYRNMPHPQYSNLGPIISKKEELQEIIKVIKSGKRGASIEKLSGYKTRQERENTPIRGYRAF